MMYFGKKFNIHFNNLSDITVDCINNIKSVITENRDIGFGNVCTFSGGNQKIKKIGDVLNIEKGFEFVLNSDSEENLSKLENIILNRISRLNFKYSIYEKMPSAELSVENSMGVHETIFNEIVTKNRDCGSAIVGSSIYHFSSEYERVEYIALANIRFSCELENVNVVLNEIISDFSDKGIDVDVEFI